jgi:hypothetical protein
MYVHTLARLTTRRFDDIAPDRENGCFQPQMGVARDRAIDYRAVIATAAIEVMVDLP